MLERLYVLQPPDYPLHGCHIFRVVFNKHCPAGLRDFTKLPHVKAGQFNVVTGMVQHVSVAELFVWCFLVWSGWGYYFCMYPDAAFYDLLRDQTVKLARYAAQVG